MGIYCPIQLNKEQQDVMNETQCQYPILSFHNIKMYFLFLFFASAAHKIALSSKLASNNNNKVAFLNSMLESNNVTSPFLVRA